MSERPLKLVISNGEAKYIPLSDEEIAQREADALAAEQARLAQEALEAEKAALKASAVEKLTALGLTAEEIQALTA